MQWPEGHGLSHLGCSKVRIIQELQEPSYIGKVYIPQNQNTKSLLAVMVRFLAVSYGLSQRGRDGLHGEHSQP